MSFGIKVSQPNFSVGTASNKNLVLSSEFNLFKVRSESGGSITLDSLTQGTASIGITDNYLGHLVFYKDENSKWRYSSTLGNDPVDNVWSSSYVSGTSLKVEVSNNTSGTQTTQYKYYIFVEQS